MNDLDKLIRETGIERTSADFTSGVMEHIRHMPAPQSISPVRISVWFKLFMGGVFAGALILVLLTMGDESSAGNIKNDAILGGMNILSGFFSIVQSWLLDYVWLIPSIFFSLAGFLYLLMHDQYVHHQYH